MMDFIAIIAMKAVRSYLNHTIGRFTAHELYLAIEHNTDLWEATPDKIKERGAFFKGRWGPFLTKYANQINTPLLIQWLKEDHPHLAKTITSSNKGHTWFDHQVTNIKNEILKM